MFTRVFLSIISSSYASHPLPFLFYVSLARTDNSVSPRHGGATQANVNGRSCTSSLRLSEIVPITTSFACICAVVVVGICCWGFLFVSAHSVFLCAMRACVSACAYVCVFVLMLVVVVVLACDCAVLVIMRECMWVCVRVHVLSKTYCHQTVAKRLGNLHYLVTATRQPEKL